jgi:hypothetical protein
MRWAINEQNRRKHLLLQVPEIHQQKHTNPEDAMGNQRTK